MNHQGLFIAATGQDVGKTTTCLGIMQGLQECFSSVGFIKPVGQKTIPAGQGVFVDKDVSLFKKHFQLTSSLEEMSPVIFPRGFTKKYLDGEVDNASLKQRILSSYQKMCAAHPFVLVEGTGHCGVGALCDLHNAQVASLLGLEVVLVTDGGLGKAFDQLTLNKSLLDQLGVPLRGVVLNRVKESKRDMLQHYFSKALAKWNVPLLGLIPESPLLTYPTVQDYLDLFKTSLISGHEHRLWHFEHFRLVATSLKVYEEVFVPNQLVITPATREDIILAKIRQHEATVASSDKGVFGGGVLMTGHISPSSAILDALKKSSLPSLYAKISAYDALQKISHFTAKIHEADTFKICKAIKHTRTYLDMNRMLECNR